MYLPSLAGGVLCGLFGTGGGIPLVFAMAKRGVGRSKYRITLSLTVLFSIFAFCLKQAWTVAWQCALPLLLASGAGGWLGSRLLFSVKSVWVNRLFAVLLICSGGLMIWRCF